MQGAKLPAGVEGLLQLDKKECWSRIALLLWKLLAEFRRIGGKWHGGDGETEVGWRTLRRHPQSLQLMDLATRISWKYTQ